MKIEEYASTIYESEDNFRTGPELIAKGMRIGLEIAYQCWMWDFEREDEELSAVAKHLRCVFDAIKSGERDVPGVGE